VSALRFDPRAVLLELEARGESQPVRADTLEWREWPGANSDSTPAAKAAKAAKLQENQLLEAAKLKLNSAKDQPVRHGVCF
jgi:hypothetical protein